MREKSGNIKSFNAEALKKLRCLSQCLPNIHLNDETSDHISVDLRIFYRGLYFSSFLLSNLQLIFMAITKNKSIFLETLFQFLDEYYDLIKKFNELKTVRAVEYWITELWSIYLMTDSEEKKKQLQQLLKRFNVAYKISLAYKKRRKIYALVVREGLKTIADKKKILYYEQFIKHQDKENKSCVIVDYLALKHYHIIVERNLTYWYEKPEGYISRIAILFDDKPWIVADTSCFRLPHKIFYAIYIRKYYRMKLYPTCDPAQITWINKIIKKLKLPNHIRAFAQNAILGASRCQ